MRLLIIAVTITSYSILCRGQQQNRTILWRLKEGERFEYRLSGMVIVRGKKRVETRLWGRLFVEGKKEGRLLFLQSIDQMRWRENNISYMAPKEELDKMRQSFEFSTDGRVLTEGPAKQDAQDLLTSLFPIPNSLKQGHIERVDLPKLGVSGSLRVVGKRRCMGRECLYLRLEATSAENQTITKELLTEAYFDTQKGGFVRVERTIRDRKKKKEEFLVLTVVGEPGSPSPEALAEAMIKELRSQVARDPDDTKARCKLSRLLLERGRPKEALQNALEGLRRIRDVGLYVVASESAVAGGDARLGLGLAEAALLVSPDDKMALLAASRAAFYLQKYKKAAHYAAAAVKGNKCPYQALYFLGASLAKLGKKEEARRVLKEYIRKNPNLDPKRKWLILFTPQNDVQILAERRFPGDLAKKHHYTVEELETARQLLAVLVKDESVRMRLTTDEIQKMLEYMANIYGKKPLQMLSDFLSDRVQAYNRLKRLLEEHERVPPKKIEEFLEKNRNEPTKCAAALSLYHGKEILKRYINLNKRFPARIDINLHLLRLYLTNPGRYRKEAGKILGFLRNMEPDNALYPLLFAWLEMEMEKPEKVALWVRRALKCSFIKTRLRDFAVERFGVLSEVGYDSGLRGVAAWTTLDTKFVNCVKEVMQGVVRVAECLLERGELEKAVRWGYLAAGLGMWLGSHAEEAKLVVAAAATRERGMVVVEAAAMRGGPADIKDVQDQLNAARNFAHKVAKAWYHFHLKKERATTVWVITAPKKCWSFIDRLFKIGERALLFECLKKQGGKE